MMTALNRVKTTMKTPRRALQFSVYSITLLGGTLGQFVILMTGSSRFAALPAWALAASAGALTLAVRFPIGFGVRHRKRGWLLLRGGAGLLGLSGAVWTGWPGLELIPAAIGGTLLGLWLRQGGQMPARSVRWLAWISLAAVLQGLLWFGLSRLAPAWDGFWMGAAILPALVTGVGPAPPQRPPAAGRQRRTTLPAAVLAGVFGLAAARAELGTPVLVRTGTLSGLADAGALLVLLVVAALGARFLAVRTAWERSGHLAAVGVSLAMLAWLAGRPGTGWALPGLVLLSGNLLGLYWLTTSQRGGGGVWPATMPLAAAVGWLTALMVSSGEWRLLLAGACGILVATVPALIAPERVAEGAALSPPPPWDPDLWFNRARLTQQERRIVRLLLDGYSNQAIIGELYISINTLKTHLRNIYRKTETRNRLELIDQIRRKQEAIASE
ncbi:MAG: helix-turn-helix transcriptional regulator [Thermaerobacter sp.]|nr:helix-turn-helix transcriptional regulator [Thermaerobacter sp.]